MKGMVIIKMLNEIHNQKRYVDRTEEEKYDEDNHKVIIPEILDGYFVDGKSRENSFIFGDSIERIIINLLRKHDRKYYWNYIREQKKNRQDQLFDIICEYYLIDVKPIRYNEQNERWCNVKKPHSLDNDFYVFVDARTKKETGYATSEMVMTWSIKEDIYRDRKNIYYSESPDKLLSMTDLMEILAYSKRKETYSDIQLKYCKKIQSWKDYGCKDDWIQYMILQLLT